jgi:hypothetical protein
MRGANRKLTPREQAAAAALHDLDLTLVPLDTTGYAQPARYSLLATAEHARWLEGRRFATIDTVEQFIAQQQQAAAAPAETP